MDQPLKKDSSHTQPETKSRKVRKSGRSWFFFALIFFLGGLFIGFEEESEWELLKDQGEEIYESVTSPNYEPRVWRRAITKYKLEYSYHFDCRLDCRNISLEEVMSSLEPKNLISYEEFVVEENQLSHRNGEIKYSIKGRGYQQGMAEGRPLKTVFSVNTQKRKVRFITVVDLSVPRQEDPCGDKKCQFGEDETPFMRSGT